MTGKRIAALGVLGGIGIGIAVLASPVAFSTAREFAEGFLGIPRGQLSHRGKTVDLRADAAAPALSRELETNELQELFQGMVDRLHGRYAAAVPVLGKYAMLGNKDAQSAIGGMYYFGHGLPIDRQEGMRWFGLAAAQGGLSEQQTLIAAANGTLKWETAEGPRLAYAGGVPFVPQFGPGLSAQAPSYDGSPYGEVASGIVSQSIANNTLSSIETPDRSESASRRYAQAQIGDVQLDSASPSIRNGGEHEGNSLSPNRMQPPFGRSGASSSPTRIEQPSGRSGAINPATGEFYAPAGTGYVSTRDGIYFAPAGPNGVVNTRTGEFVPAN